MLKKRAISALVAIVLSFTSLKARAEDLLSFRLEGGISLGNTSEEVLNLSHHYNGSLSLEEEVRISENIRSKLSILSYNDFNGLDAGLVSTSTNVDLRSPIKVESVDVDFFSKKDDSQVKLLSIGLDLRYLIDRDKSFGSSITILDRGSKLKHEEKVDGSSTKRISVLDPENLNEYVETTLIQVNENSNFISSTRINGRNLIPSIYYRNNNYGIELILDSNDDRNRNLMKNSTSGTEILSERDGNIVVRDYNRSHRIFDNGISSSSDFHLLAYYDYLENRRFKFGLKSLVADNFDFSLRCTANNVKGYSFFSQFNSLDDRLYFGLLERENNMLFDFLKHREFLDPRIPEQAYSFLEDLEFVRALSSYNGFYVGAEYAKEDNNGGIFSYDFGYCGRQVGLLGRINGGGRNSLLVVFNRGMALSINLGEEVSLGVMGTIYRN